MEVQCVLAIQVFSSLHMGRSPYYRENRETIIPLGQGFSKNGEKKKPHYQEETTNRCVLLDVVCCLGRPYFDNIAQIKICFTCQLKDISWSKTVPRFIKA